jgi:hypothetical protein
MGDQEEEKEKSRNRRLIMMGYQKTEVSGQKIRKYLKNDSIVMLSSEYVSAGYL